MAMQKAFPAYLVGVNFSACTVTFGTVAADGTFTAGTVSGDLAATGVMDEFNIQRTRTLAQIQPINSQSDTFVPLAIGFTATIGQIRKGDGTSFLAAGAALYNYVEVVLNVTPPGGTASYTEAVFGVIESSETAYVAEKNMITLTIRPVGVPTFAGAYTLTPFG